MFLYYLLDRPIKSQILLATFPKCSIFDVWHGCKYVFRSQMTLTLLQCQLWNSLIHLFTMHPFSTTRNPKVLWCFQGLGKWCIGKKGLTGAWKNVMTFFLSSVQKKISFLIYLLKKLLMHINANWLNIIDLLPTSVLRNTCLWYFENTTQKDMTQKLKFSFRLCY